MLRSLIIAITIWPSVAELAGVVLKSKEFPVQMEPDKGDAKPGEGLGGVAVLLKPMPEATTMKTWSFLKESMMKIGDQVKQIMQVRNDMAMLQEHLTSQEKLWKQAEIEMKQENAKMRAEVESLKTQVKVGAAINGELLKVKQALEDEKRRTQDLNNQADMQEEQWQLQLQFLQNRKNNVRSKSSSQSRRRR